MVAAMRSGAYRTKMRRHVFVSLFVGVGACATQPSVDELVSTPVVVTKFDTKVDFSTFETFAMNPTVSVVRDIGDGGTLRPETAAAIVDRIAANMTARGYRMVAPADHPSIGLQATVTLQINTVSVASAGSWWGVPGYAGAPTYWGFPAASYYTPWSYSTQAYRAGTLVIEAVDLRDGLAMVAPAGSVVGPGAEGGTAGLLEVVWTAYAHGVTTTLLSSFGPQASYAIDQAFAQSPYLRRQGETP
jgi:hypothetical protein